MNADVAAFLSARILGDADGATLDALMDVDLVEQGHVDSIGVVRLVADIETAFDIAVSDDEFASDAFRTIRGIEALILSKRTEAGAPPADQRAAQALVDAYLAPDAAGRRFVFGRNAFSKALLPVLPCDGVIDDYSAGEDWAGLPVLAGDVVPPGAVIVNSVLTARPRISRARIEALKPSCVVEYADLIDAGPAEVPTPDFMVETRAHVAAHPDSWADLRAALADATSRETLDAVLRYRTTARPEALAGWRYDPAAQYFDPVAALRPQPTFLDVGAFDGQTTLEFIKRHPDYRQVHVFEPEPANMTKTRAALAERRDIAFHAVGLSDEPGALAFRAGEGSASLVDPSGEATIQVARLDDVVKSAVDFIKMDLEGWEPAALRGARRRIEIDRPTLAIACYHSAADFITIFSICRGFHPDYVVHLRHYTEGWIETVMYFTPPETLRGGPRDGAA